MVTQDALQNWHVRLYDHKFKPRSDEYLSERRERINALLEQREEIAAEIKRIMKWTDCVNVEQLKYKLHLLKHDTEAAKGHGKLHNDYEKRLFSYQWTLSGVQELEREGQSIESKLTEMHYFFE